MAMTTNQQKTDVYYWRYKHYSNYDSFTPYPGIDRRLDPLNPANFVRLSLSSSWAVFIFFTGLGASSSVSLFLFFLCNFLLFRLLTFLFLNFLLLKYRFYNILVFFLFFPLLLLTLLLFLLSVFSGRL